MSTITREALKYGIKERLAKYSKYDRLKLQDQIIADLGCSSVMFYIMINITAESVNDIKGGYLKTFAKHLKCSVDALYNEK